MGDTSVIPRLDAFATASIKALSSRELSFDGWDNGCEGRFAIVIVVYNDMVHARVRKYGMLGFVV